MKCNHPTFAVETRVGRLLRDEGDTYAVGFTAEVRIKCTKCHEPFQFLGLPAGSSPTGPTVSADGQELRAAIAPADNTATPLDVAASQTSQRH